MMAYRPAGQPEVRGLGLAASAFLIPPPLKAGLLSRLVIHPIRGSHRQNFGGWGTVGV